MDLREERKKCIFVIECVRVRESTKGITGEVPVVHQKNMSDHVVESTFELSAFMKGEF